MGNEVIAVIEYFSIFKYPPDFDEIYTYFSKKAPKKAVKMAVLKLERQKRIKAIYKKLPVGSQGQRYTVGEYTTPGYINDLERRKIISQGKLDNWRFRLYLKLISYLPQIKLVGLSGSISMFNANDGDDIDLFIITSNKRLFTARIFCLFIIQLLGLRRKFGDREAKDKICLNLFFDESDLKIPKYKQTAFVGHEVLQMKPLIDKNQTYFKFLKANEWVYKLFPNADKPKASGPATKPKGETLTGEVVERVLKYMEIKLINSHKTTELITDTQLWFHPDDFEKKLNGKIK